MLKLNVNQEKQLTFEVQLGGIQSDQIKSYLRIEIDEIEYGFPAEVRNESISVNLPPLRSVTARKLKEGDKVEVKLEIVADGNYLIPWKDTIQLSNPMVIEAKIMDDDEAPTFKTKLVTEVTHEDVEPENLTEAEDKLTEKIVRKLAKQLARKKLNEDEAEEIEKDEIEVDAESDAEIEDEVDESCGKPHNEGFKPSDLRTIDKEFVYAYMERAGSKNPQIQKIIYEQAEKAAKTSRPLYVLKQVVKILKTKK